MARKKKNLSLIINNDENSIEINNNHHIELESDENMIVEHNEIHNEPVKFIENQADESQTNVVESQTDEVEAQTDEVEAQTDEVEKEPCETVKKTKDITTNESINLDTRIEFINDDIIVDNLSFDNIDYTNTIYNGEYCHILACEEIKKFNSLEKLIYNGKLWVKNTTPSSTNIFIGIAQNDAKPGEIVKILTKGISIVNVRTKINLPLLKHNSQGQLTVIKNNNNQYITQLLSIPINKNDLLVLAGTTNDILVGPNTRYYNFNNLNCNGLLSPYKSIIITNNLIYNINYNEQNTILNQKVNYGNKFIQVLDINSDSNEIIGYLN